MHGEAFDGAERVQPAARFVVEPMPAVSTADLIWGGPPACCMPGALKLAGGDHLVT